MGSLRKVTSLVVVLALFATNVARADDPTWRVRWEIDVPVVAVELALAFSWLLGPQLAPAYCAPLCDRGDLWAVDRIAAGRHNRVWARTGDVGVGLVFAGGLATLLADEGWAAGFSDYVVWIESVLGAMSLANLTSLAVRRPRPYVYGESASAADRMNGTASLSFFSGHTATAFAGAVALFQAMRMRHPEGAGQWIALGAGLAVAATVGASRVLAGEHFPTDVFAGALVGSAMGWLVPELHRRELSLAVNADATTASVMLSGLF